jgi:hypothetical protein
MWTYSGVICACMFGMQAIVWRMPHRAIQIFQLTQVWMFKLARQLAKAIRMWRSHTPAQCAICRVGQKHLNTVFYGIFGREIAKYTVIYGVYIRFWPTLAVCVNLHKAAGWVALNSSQINKDYGAAVHLPNMPGTFFHLAQGSNAQS